MRSSSGISRWQFVHELDQKSTSVTVPEGCPRAFIHSEAVMVGRAPQSLAEPESRAHWAKSPRASTSVSGSQAPVSHASPSPAWRDAV